MKTLVLGLGNPILGDDGIGIRVVQELRKRVNGVEFKECSIAGVGVLDEIDGYDRVVIIDAIKTGTGDPGTIYKLKLENFDKTCPMGSHGCGLATVIELGRRIGYKVPKVIDIYAIEVKNNEEFGEDLTPELAKQMDNIVETIAKEISRAVEN